MFAIFLIFVLVTAHAADFSSYIHICGQKDPNYDQCVMDNLYSILDKICKGFPELDIPPNEPIIVDKIVIYDINNLKLFLNDTKLYGICNLVINSIHTDPDRLHFNFNFTINHLFINTSYGFNIHILVPLANKGLLFITTDNVSLIVNMDLKLATKNSEKKIYVQKVNSNLHIEGFKYEFDESEKELVQLHQAFNNVIENNTKDIINIIIPIFEKKISQLFISNFDSLIHSNYEKFFPEKA